MRKLYVFLLIFSTILISLLIVKPSYAISPDVVISQIKVGNSSASRLVEIYNNSNSSVDITGWCLKYSSPSNASPYTNLGCFIGSNLSEHVFINARSFALLASSQMGIKTDIILMEGLGNGTSGHVYLLDNVGNEIDRVGWGVAASAEGTPVQLDSTKVIERKRDVALNKLIDTDNNESDFVVSTLRSTYQYGAIYEVVDACGNIDGLQEIVPDGMESDGSGSCAMHDECSNLPDIQTTIPNGYKRGNENICLLNLLPLKITEMLPNAIGTDEGNEFIELYNPNDINIDLTNYVLYIGINNTKFNFPVGSNIGTGHYLTFSNDEIKFTLVNTTGNVILRSVDDTLIDETPIYENPGDGMAWAVIDNIWQYTDQPTPGVANVVSSVEIDSVVVLTSNLAPCADNQYRSPETNRCRLIATSTSSPVPCKDGQYRSEETNRCRSIASDVSQLMPCAEGQERNPATNRCRSTTAVLGANNLTPCKAGQERNPDTNRCRNVVGTIPTAGYAPEQANESSNNSIMMWSLISVGAIAICYGIWEWRQEIINVLKKVRFLILNK